MLEQPKQLVIIGGGASIAEGVEKGLWEKLKNKFVIGTNYSYKFFPNPTCQCFVDNDFYFKNCEGMKNIGLIVGNRKRNIVPLPNTILLPPIAKYHRDVTHGVYKASLAGLFTLSLAIHLLDEGEIFLLGYDYGEARKSDFEKYIKNRVEFSNVVLKDKRNRAITHFYQGDIEHRGIGKTNYYNAQNRADQDFKVYKDEKKVKIYNVSQISKIPSEIFEKLSYDEFFKKLNTETVNQGELQKIIREKINYEK